MERPNWEELAAVAPELRPTRDGYPKGLDSLHDDPDGLGCWYWKNLETNPEGINCETVDDETAAALWRDSAVRWLTANDCSPQVEISHMIDRVPQQWTVFIRSAHTPEPEDYEGPNLSTALFAAVRAVLIADGKLPTEPRTPPEP